MTNDTIFKALRAAKRLFDEVLPKFDWGASALDANAIELLNTVPALVDKALAVPPPLGGHTAAEAIVAFEWLRELALSDGAPPQAGVALDLWAAAAPLPCRESTAAIGHVKRSEWESLSPEAQAKLEQITGEGSRALALEQAQASQDMRGKSLSHESTAQAGAAPDVLAMREALQSALDLLNRTQDTLAHYLAMHPSRDSDCVSALLGLHDCPAARKVSRQLNLAIGTAPSPEPLAWKCSRCGSTTGEACNAVGCFANEAAPAAQGDAPAVATQEGRKPLTVSQIDEAWSLAYPKPNRIREFARAIERALGIDPGAMGQSGGAA